MSLTNSDMENMAKDLRSKLSISDEDPLDPFKISLSDVTILFPSKVSEIPNKTLARLNESTSWSAMSVPLDKDQESWVILVNEANDIGRQRVSLLEEFWHIVQGHKLTEVVKVAGHFGRSFEENDEHDAYYLAAATLVPRQSLVKKIKSKTPVEKIAGQYGVSKELVEYRIKRCGLWSEYRGKKISLSK